MIPKWLQESDQYAPVKDRSIFVVKTIETIGTILSRLKVQHGHEKKHAIPALIKFFVLVGLILLLSISQHRMILLTIAAVVQAYLCLWPARDIWSIMKTSLFAAFLALLIFLPAMIMNPAGIYNHVFVILKVFVTVEMVSIFNHTTQWNHITKALRKLHIPSIFIFTLDLTLKYIVLLGTLIRDLLTALRLRSVGRNQHKYQSIGGVMGVTFIRSVEMSHQMYEAMKCRGFTDDYKGL